MTQWKSGFVPEHLYDAYRRQALYDIRQKTDFLASLNDGRNVEGFSAMRATGKYVTHHIVSEEEFTSLYYQAYLRNGLLRKIGRNSFIKSVRRALDGCTGDALPGLNRLFMNEEASTCQQPLPVPDPETVPSDPFDDRKLLSEGYQCVQVYPFFDEHGTPVFQKLRYHLYPKQDNCYRKMFLLRHKGADGAWYSGRGPYPDYPYNLSDLIADKTSLVLLCEGEKDADAARGLGYPAVSVSNWQDCAGYFRDRDVVILPDNDRAGQVLAQRARDSLLSVARSISIIELPGLDEKGDVSDWIEAGGTAEMLRTLLDASGFRKNLDGRAVSGGTYELRKGKPVCSPANIALALGKLGVQLALNRLSNTIEIRGLESFCHFSDPAANRLRFILWEQEGMKCNKEIFIDIVSDIAEKQAYHPVLDYLSGLHWDAVPRVESFFIDCAGAEDNKFVRAITRIWFTAAVRRIFEPGTDFQELVILEGKQGRGKSTAIRRLCPDPSWFSDDLPLNASTKMIVEQTMGKWIIEASELTGRNHDTRALKRFLSATTDRTRLAYERLAKDFPRQWIAIGTTNESEYLVDSTGNRRFWPIRITEFDLARLTDEYRDQLWAEAVELHRQGLGLKLDPSLWDDAEAEQDKRFHNDPWEETLRTLLPDQDCTITVASVLEALCLSHEKRDRRAALRAGYIMRKLGFEKTTARHPVSGKVFKVWVLGKGGPILRLTFSGVIDI